MSQKSVREALKTFSDGLTRTEISKVIGKPATSCWKAIKKMPDVYIDRWVCTKRGRFKYTPVYLLVDALADVPENAPMPD